MVSHDPGLAQNFHQPHPGIYIFSRLPKAYKEGDPWLGLSQILILLSILAYAKIIRGDLMF